MAQQAKSSTGQIVTLIVIAVILAAGYVALDFYSDGERNKAIAESRGTQLVQALSKYRLESNAYPEALDKLAPKYLQQLPQCPGGEAFAYKAQGTDYTLTCPNVVFKTKPYTFDSKTRTWQG